MKTPIPDYLNEVIGTLREDTTEATASYIPELADADPDLFALAVTTGTGSTY
ncbi:MULTISPECIES: hypothetical protein [unclassified Arthrobacter]|uniref:hypothetical protein n=1 Tax=unclassified Arthrobacter TaxID=235627 RepID=UPI002157C690|nr:MULTISPECIES: hypothetical protein [unclassified Arthrobacter]